MHKNYMEMWAQRCMTICERKQGGRDRWSAQYTHAHKRARTGEKGINEDMDMNVWIQVQNHAETFPSRREQERKRDISSKHSMHAENCMAREDPGIGRHIEKFDDIHWRPKDTTFPYSLQKV